MLAPVAFLQHINSIPLLVLATLDSDMVSASKSGPGFLSGIRA